MPLLSYGFHEIWCREGHCLLVDISETAFTCVW